MKEVELTAIQIPSGNICFKEARLIIECRLTQVTSPKPDDFYKPEAKDWIKEAAYSQANDHRKYIFREITHVWVKKENRY